MPTPEIMIEPRPVPGRRAPERPLAPERSRPVPPPPPEAAAPKKPRRWWRVARMAAADRGCSGADGRSMRSTTCRRRWTTKTRWRWSAASTGRSVRQGLREDLRVMLGSSRFGEAAPDSTVDPLSTQRAVVALIRAARLNERGWEIAQPGQNGPASRGFELLRIRYAFFTGGPFAFRVDLRPDSDTVKRPLVLLFRWSGDWRLTRVFLPGDAFGNTPPPPRRRRKPHRKPRRPRPPHPGRHRLPCRKPRRPARKRRSSTRRTRRTRTARATPAG